MTLFAPESGWKVLQAELMSDEEVRLKAPRTS